MSILAHSAIPAIIKVRTAGKEILCMLHTGIRNMSYGPTYKRLPRRSSPQQMIPSQKHSSGSCWLHRKIDSAAHKESMRKHIIIHCYPLQYLIEFEFELS